MDKYRRRRLTFLGCVAAVIIIISGASKCSSDTKSGKKTVPNTSSGTSAAQTTAVTSAGSSTSQTTTAAAVTTSAVTSSDEASATETTAVTDIMTVNGIKHAPDNTILVNATNHLPPNYQIETVELENGVTVSAEIYPYLMDMLDAASADGYNLSVDEGYRTVEYQQQLMDNKIYEMQTYGYTYDEAVTEAEKWVAPVGTSEHQLGLALDINGDGVTCSNEAAYEWLYANAYKYGFVLRYPEGKADLTGINYEPWHYRYVGTDAAAEMYASGVCLEEYVAAGN